MSSESVSSGCKPWRTHASSAEEELVVSGMAGRFPECENVDELSYNLYNKVRAVQIQYER